MTTHDSPLLTALPPTTDYISYLTIVEQYLSRDNLPILHRVLQDETLTINIGWDLIHLLLPLLPESKECLETIAQLGNPREVILKATEALRLIDVDEDTPEVIQDNQDSGEENAAQPATPTSLATEQFVTLLSMLVTLHGRIKTKYPSRFLSTTLQAILSSFSQSIDNREELVVSIVQTVNSIRGIRRPPPPSRASSGTLSRQTTRSDTHQPLEDPEASATTDVTPDEVALQTKLFQSFITHVLEEYLTTLLPANGLSHMGWTSRLLEKLHPERVIPHSKTMTSRFAEHVVLSNRVDSVGRIASLSQDLHISGDALLAAITSPQSGDAPTDSEEEPPATAADVALSGIGSLLLYVTKHVSASLYGRPLSGSSEIHIFPDHDTISRAILSENSDVTIGGEPEAVLDALLALGILALADDRIGTPDSDTQFADYLQRIALLASNCPDPGLRGHAHYVVSTVLRSHPDDQVRFHFIRDTLENSPADNLKPIAVGWLKGEIVEAVLVPQVSGKSLDSSMNARSRHHLDSFAPLLFPALGTRLLTADLLSAWSVYQRDLSFYLASLNFLYLLLHSEQLCTALDMQTYLKRHDISARFIQPLDIAKDKFLTAIDTNEHGIVQDASTQEIDALRAELNVLSQSLHRYQDALVSIG